MLLGRMARSPRHVGLLPSSARTASTFSSIDVGSATHVMLYGRISVASGTGGLYLALQNTGKLSASHVITAPSSLITTKTDWSCMFGPACGRFSNGGVGEAVPCVLPATFYLGVYHSDASSYTYEVAYVLF